MNINHCGYNDFGIRCYVIFPNGDGWAVAGVHEGWTTHSPLKKFATVDAAKEHIGVFKQGPTRLTWKEETV